MAKKGNSKKVGKLTTAPDKKDFQGSGVEGQKGADEEPTTIDKEQVGKAARLAAIALAINALDPVSEDYTSGGAPAVTALEEVLGFDITAEERDQAFEIFNTPPEEPTPAKQTAPAKVPTKQSEVVTVEMVLEAQRKKGKKV